MTRKPLKYDVAKPLVTRKPLECDVSICFAIPLTKKTGMILIAFEK